MLVLLLPWNLRTEDRQKIGRLAAFVVLPQGSRQCHPHEKGLQKINRTLPGELSVLLSSQCSQIGINLQNQDRGMG